MDRIHHFLYDINLMSKYHQIYQRPPNQPVTPGQLLQLFHNDKLWQPSIVRMAKRDFCTGDNYSPTPNDREHFHNVYHVTYYRKGQNSVIVNGKKVTVREGSLLVIPPGISHSVMPQELSTISQFALTFEYLSGNEEIDCSVEKLIELLFGISISKPKIVTRLLPQQAMRVETALLSLHDSLYDTPKKSSQKERKSLLLFLDLLSDIFSGSQEQRSKAVDERLLRVKGYLEKNYIAEPNLDELAELASLSKGYLIRAFKKEFGHPPLAYRQQLRIESACRRLAESSEPLKSIASGLGFDNVYYFSRIFKQQTGEPPGAYRKKLMLD